MLTTGQFTLMLKNEGIERDRKTIRNWCEKGLPGAKKIGGVWEIPEETLKIVLDGGWDTYQVGRG